MFLLSGGTTGLPKLIPRSHNDYRYNAEVSSEVAGLDPDSVSLIGACLRARIFRSRARAFLARSSAAGGSVVMLQSPEPGRAFAAIAEHGVTHVAAVPAVVQRWIDHEESNSTGQLATLRVLQVGGSRLVDELAARVRPVLGATLQQVFGMAEGLLNMTALDDPDDVVVGTQGRPISPGDEVRIVDDNGVALPAGERGVLQTRGPYTLCGYYRAAEHNRRSFASDGWYITGDIVELRDDGNLVVQGRDKDLINRAGEKISGEEVENLLYRHPGIEINAAVAMPDPVLGERVCVFATLRAGHRVEGLEDLRRLMSDAGAAAYKLPEVLVIVDEMPLATKVGKIDKKALREDLTRRGDDHPWRDGDRWAGLSTARFVSQTPDTWPRVRRMRPDPDVRSRVRARRLSPAPRRVEKCLVDPVDQTVAHDRRDRDARCEQPARHQYEGGGDQPHPQRDAT